MCVFLNCLFVGGCVYVDGGGVWICVCMCVCVWRVGVRECGGCSTRTSRWVGDLGESVCICIDKVGKGKGGAVRLAAALSFTTLSFFGCADIIHTSHNYVQHE